MSLEEAVYVLKRGYQTFAKRQLTWFKRERDVIWIQADEAPQEELLELMMRELRARAIVPQGPGQSPGEDAIPSQDGQILCYSKRIPGVQDVRPGAMDRKGTIPK